MTTTGIADLKARLSEYLAKVKAGDEVLITERGTPIARICPLPKEVVLEDGIPELERAGLIRRPSRSLGSDFLDLPRTEDPQSAVLAALLAEREENW
jgi:prevent-host-death family protein